MMIRLGDVNGDGASDVVAADFSNTVEGALVYLNNGDGTFAPPGKYLPGQHRGSIAIGDFSGDGKPDLLLANSEVAQMDLLANDGHGMFVASAPVAGNPSSLLELDANADGKVDFVAGNALFVNQGGGTFAPVTLAAGGVLWAAGDLDGDGKTDLVASGVSVKVLINKGDGTFEARPPYAIGKNVRDVAIGDLNGDGRPDIACANDSDSTASVLLNKGNGTFMRTETYAAGPWPTSIKVGDLDGDGRPELVVANSAVGSSSVAGASYISVYRNKGDGTFAPPEKYLANVFPYSLALGDLNGDGRLDIAVGDAGGGLDILINTAR